MIYIELHPEATRLGNWMFQYAAAKTASGNDDVTFVIEKEEYWASVQKYACLWGSTGYCAKAPEGVETRQDLYQDKKFINRELALRLFQCPEKIEAKICAKYGEWLQDSGLVSIHVRRGDYLRLPHRHPFVGKKYLLEAIERFPSNRFLVFSDDIPWCKSFFRGSIFYFAEGNSVLEDLFLMTKCQGGHICSNSTFSWWGAYLSPYVANNIHKVIFPSMWYGPAVDIKDWSGMYFEGSEVIENSYTPLMRLKASWCMMKNECGDLMRKCGMR